MDQVPKPLSTNPIPGWGIRFRLKRLHAWAPSRRTLAGSLGQKSPLDSDQPMQPPGHCRLEASRTPPKEPGSLAELRPGIDDAPIEGVRIYLNPEAEVIHSTRRCAGAFALAGLYLVTSAAPSLAQANDATVSAAQTAAAYRVVPDITYLTAEGWENKLDLYLPRDPVEPAPTVLYFHGGFWVRGSRTQSSLNVMPYLGMGWAAVNVSYRLGGVSHAPAAVEDVLCAVRWVMRNADEHGLDPSRIVVTGHSAGGHLALSAGMLGQSTGLDARCAGDEPIEVAAVVNWYGPTDVGDFLEGPNRQNLVVEWLGSGTDRFEVAERISPLNHVRDDLPPILTIHGDQDLVVPYDHAVRLHDALDAAGAIHELHTVPGGAHGGFSPEETRDIFDAIDRFLTEHVIVSGQ